jgi:hypothetical protein
MVGAVESGTEPLGSKKLGEVFGYLRSYWWINNGQAGMCSYFILVVPNIWFDYTRLNLCNICASRYSS